MANFDDVVLPPAVAKLIYKLDQMESRLVEGAVRVSQMAEGVTARLERLERLADAADARGEQTAGSVHWAELQLRQVNANLSRIADAMVALLRQHQGTPSPQPPEPAAESAEGAWEEWRPRANHRN